jgi:site-specific recombinase XerD
LAEAYQLWLIDEREIRHRFSTRTYGLCLSSLKQWGAYLVGQHLLPENPFQTLTGPDRSDSHARGFLTREQANRLLASFDRAQLIEHRDALICQLMLTAGARETELCQATIADFDRTGRQLWLQSKGKQIRESVPLTAPVTAELEAYLARRSAHDPDLSEHDPLLATIRQPGTDRRPHLGTHELRRRLHRAIARAKLTTRHITGVSLRNTCAIQAFLDGIPFHDVQALMRHRDKKTTKLFEQRAKRIRRGSKRSASTAIHP